MTEETNTVTDAPVADVPAAEAPVADAVVENVEVAPEAQSEVGADSSATEDIAEKSMHDGATSESDEDEEDKKKKEEMTAKSNEAIAVAVAEIKSSLDNAFGDLAATVKALYEQVAALSKSLDTVTESVTSVTKEVSDFKGNFNEFGKRVDKVEADTAFRKSGDLGEIVQEMAEMPTQKSLWGGRFLKNTDLFTK